MEFPNLGEHCEESTCKTLGNKKFYYFFCKILIEALIKIKKNFLDFLPFKCDSCKKVFWYFRNSLE